MPAQSSPSRSSRTNANRELDLGRCACWAAGRLRAHADVTTGAANRSRRSTLVSDRLAGDIQLKGEGMTHLWRNAVKRVRRSTRTSALLAASVVIATAAGLADAGVAFACEAYGAHCYALAQWNVPEGLVGGVNTDIYTAAAEVPGAPNRMQNETWADFSYGGWVEAGDTIGYIGYTHPHWSGQSRLLHGI
jgi:hypothetical protein